MTNQNELFKNIVKTIKENEKYLDFNLSFAKTLNEQQLEEYSVIVAKEGSQEMMFELLENVQGYSNEVLIDGICKKGDINFIVEFADYAIEKGLPLEQIAQTLITYEQNMTSTELEKIRELERFYQLIEWFSCEDEFEA